MVTGESAAAHDGGQHRDIRDLEHIHKVVEQHLGAAVCKRLVDGDEAYVTGSRSPSS